MTLEMRFWEKVDRRGDLECWPWLGVTVKGYGIFWVDSKRRAARAHVCAVRALLAALVAAGKGGA